MSFNMNSRQHSLLTGSIPRGYGPLKTPVTFGSRVRKRFPLISAFLTGHTKTVLNVGHLETNAQSPTYLYIFKHIRLFRRTLLHEVLTSTPRLWTWPSHSIRSQRCWGTLKNSHCIWGQCRWRTGPSSGWCNAPQRTCSRSANIHQITHLTHFMTQMRIR